jgi:hypothetical protein
MSDFLWNLKNS